MEHLQNFLTTDEVTLNEAVAEEDLDDEVIEEDLDEDAVTQDLDKDVAEEQKDTDEDAVERDDCCLPARALSKTSSRASSSSVSGFTATPSPSRCGRPATSSSKTSRSSSKAASGPSAALKLGFS